MSAAWPIWTGADLDRLRRLWAQRVPIDDIARTLERTPHAVQTRAQLIGLRSRRATWTRAEEFRLWRCSRRACRRLAR